MKVYIFNQVSNNDSEAYIILNTSRKHVNYEEVPMNKPYNIQNKNICNGIFNISFFKALQILDRISFQYAPNANETNEKRTNASHERYEKCTIHETNTRYTKRMHDTRNERTNYMENANEQTHDTLNERTIHETNAR
jgi:catalase